MSIFAAVPVKDLVNAKQRLVAALPPEDRRALAAAMLEDVLDALAAAPPDGAGGRGGRGHPRRRRGRARGAPGARS